MLSTEIAACHSVSLCWAPVAPRHVHLQGFMSADPLKLRVSPSSPTSHGLQALTGVLELVEIWEQLLQRIRARDERIQVFKMLFWLWTNFTAFWESAFLSDHLVQAALGFPFLFLDFLFAWLLLFNLAFCSALQGAGDWGQRGQSSWERSGIAKRCLSQWVVLILEVQEGEEVRSQQLVIGCDCWPTLLLITLLLHYSGPSSQQLGLREEQENKAVDCKIRARTKPLEPERD